MSQKFAVSNGGDNRYHVVDTNQPRGQAFIALCGFRPKLSWRTWSAVSTKYEPCWECLRHKDCQIVGDIADIREPAPKHRKDANA